MLDPSFGLTLWHVLIVLFALACCAREAGAVGIAALLLLNWIVCTYLVPTVDARTGLPVWWAYAIVDGLTMSILTYRAERLVTLAVAGFLLATMAAHLTVGFFVLLSNDSVISLPVQLSYWEFTHWFAWLEAWTLAMIVGKGLYDAILAWGLVRRDRSSWSMAPAPHLSHRQGTEQARAHQEMAAS